MRDEWIKIGLSTQPSDREAAQAAISDAYRMARLETPRHWIWFDNPSIGYLGAWMLTQTPAAKNQLRNLASEEAGAQALVQICNQIEEQLPERRWNEVGTQVGQRVRRHVWNQAVEQVRTQVGAQRWFQVTGLLLWSQVQHLLSPFTGAEAGGVTGPVWPSEPTRGSETRYTEGVVLLP